MLKTQTLANKSGTASDTVTVKIGSPSEYDFRTMSVSSGFPIPIR